MANEGQTIGGIAGAAIGSTVPGVGTALGAGVGQGLGGLIDSFAAGKRADRAAPPIVDPFEQARLNELQQTRRAISTGSDVATQSAISEVRKAGAQTQQAVSRVTGGDVGGTIDALLKAQRGTQTATAAAVAKGQERLPFFENLTQQLGTRVSQRKLELGLLNQAQARAETAQAGKDALANLNVIAATEGSLPGGEPDMLGGLLSTAAGKIFGGGAAAPGAGPAGATPPIIAPTSNLFGGTQPTSLIPPTAAAAPTTTIGATSAATPTPNVRNVIPANEALSSFGRFRF